MILRSYLVIATFLFLFFCYFRLAQLVCVAAQQHGHLVDHSESVDHPHEHPDSAFEFLWTAIGPVQAQLPPRGVPDAGMLVGGVCVFFLLSHLLFILA